MNNMEDLPLKYLPEEVFNECVELLNPPKATGYKWEILADQLGVPREKLEFFPSVQTPETPAAAQVLRWFQKRDGTLGQLINVLLEFPRNDVVGLLKDESVLQGMRERSRRNDGTDKSSLRMAGEEGDPVEGFHQDSQATKQLQSSPQNINNVNIENVAELTITGATTIVHTHSCPNCKSAHPFSDTSGSSASSSGSNTPSSGGSPTGARPKERQGRPAQSNSSRTRDSSDHKSGRKFQDSSNLDKHQQHGLRRQFSNTSNVSTDSYEIPFVAHGGSFIDAESDESSLNSGDLGHFDPSVHQGITNSNNFYRQSRHPISRQQSYPAVESWIATDRRRVEENRPEQTAPNRNDHIIPFNISGPVLLLCDTGMMKHSTDIILNVGKVIRHRFSIQNGQNPVQFNLWGPNRCRYSADKDIREEIKLSLERSSLVVIFASKRYLKKIGEVERNLQKVPDVEPDRCNEQYVYYQLQKMAMRDKVVKKKLVVFCGDEMNNGLPLWLRVSGIVHRWPQGTQEIIDVIWGLLTKQAKLMLRALSSP